MSMSPDTTRHNFTLEILLSFSFDGTEEEAKEKLIEDISSFNKIITEDLTGSGLEYAVSGGTVSPLKQLSTVLGWRYGGGFQKRYNFNLEVLLSFSFDGTEEEAKDKLKEDISSFDEIITLGLTGSGLEYAVRGGEIHKNHQVFAGE